MPLRRTKHCGVGGLALVCATLVAACVDAPITPDQIEPDGQLRASALDQTSAQPPVAQGAFSAARSVAVQQAAQISAVLAAEPAGALQDASRFSTEVGQVHLHLRADGLAEPKPVVVRWTHEGASALVPGQLEPTGTMALASSFPIPPDAADAMGPWRVELLAASSPAPDAEPIVLFERTFEIVAPADLPAPAAGSGAQDQEFRPPK